MKGFRPGLAPTLALLALLPALLGLGAWQLARAEEKRALLAAYEVRRQAEPLPLDAALRLPDAAYQRVRLRGRFDAAHSLLLDNRTREGQPGVELLQPFEDLDSGHWVLLNRGWLPWPDRRQPVRFETPERPLELTAWIYLPPGAAFELKHVEGQGWPRLVNRVDAAALWPTLARQGLPYEIRLDAGPAALRADWPVVAMGPQTHEGYAVQWFAMAFALVLLYVYLGLRRAREVLDEPQSAPV
ncbi:SURF1 family protein [Pseudomonas sp. RIT-PI-AD]|uniref:SURF1 family protein n=1 Tax=Pseudomonas sp. RIT-PI-AD TaxID=3035294 RepID=UPI0021D8E4DC|nr:SURF1 family protein [Pseudomonas sp. RIT-PI-AD]